MFSILAKVGKFFYGYFIGKATGEFVEWALDYAILELVKKTDNPYDDEFAKKWIESKNKFKEDKEKEIRESN